MTGSKPSKTTRVSADVHPDVVVEMSVNKYPMETTSQFIEAALIRENMRRKGTQI